MPVDIRAIVRCSLGELISASVSDDYIQGSGLIKTKGNCEISGLINPPVGSIVTFTYTKSGIVRNVPRKLRVLSSFADPYRRTTKVELGCKLTYLQDLKDPIKWNVLNDPENSALTQAEAEIVTFPINASSIMNQCLTALQITASTNPLTNKFSVAEFDFGGGYVSTLSDLLVSESFFGYLDFNERLQVVNLSNPGNAGPSFDSGRLIDLGPIGVGDLAGDAVTVSYTTLKLRVPDDTEIATRSDAEPEPTKTYEGGVTAGWGPDIATTKSTGAVIIPYTVTASDGTQTPSTAVYSTSDFVRETTQYKQITVSTPNGTERRTVVASRTLSETKSSASIAGSIITQYLSNGFPFGNYSVSSTTRETFSYNRFGNETFRELVRTGDRLYGAGAVSVPYVITDDLGQVSAVTPPSGQMTLERTTVTSSYSNNYRQTVTRRFGPWINTLSGQQSIAEGRESLATATQISSFLNTALGGTYLLDVTVSTERSSPGAGSQEAPAPEDVNNEALADPDNADPNSGFRTEQVGEIELATGSATATRRIELTMPYAPDDSFLRRVETISPLTYSYRSRSSDARTKANRYGRAQNRLLFANRNGMNIQTVPEVFPSAPFGAFYFSANGSVTQYRTNGTSWTMDSNGIVASTDALYWGVAGKTA